MDRETLKKIYGDFNPKRKDITNDQYALRLSKVASDFNKDNDIITDEFLDEPQKVFDYLEGRPKSTIANILYSIIGYCEAKNKDKLAKIYRLKKEIADEGIKFDYSKNQFLGKQEENFISYDKVVAFVKKLDVLCDTPEKVGANYHEEWEKKEMNNVRLLFRLYLLYPRRNEFGTLRFISWRKYKQVAKLGLEENFIVMNARKAPMLSLSDYKTSKTYGTATHVITDKVLKKLIYQYYKDKGEGAYVFTLPKTNEPWKKYYVSQMLTKWSSLLTAKESEPPVDDKRTGESIGYSISTTLLYKIIVNEAEKRLDRSLSKEDFDGAVIFNDLLKDYAKIRGHKNSTQKEIYSKKVLEKEPK